MTTDLLRNLLADAGYAVSFRTEGWTECFAAQEDERWRGRGLDEDDALADVVRQMFPSSLARQLLAQHPSSPAAVTSAGAIRPPGELVEVVTEPAPGAGAASSSNGTATADPPPGPVSSDAASGSPGEQRPAPNGAGEQLLADPFLAAHAATSAGHDAPPPAAPAAPGAEAGPSANGTAPAANSSGIRAAAKTGRGLTRERNEDACIAIAERGLVAVADGLGAHPRGDVASTMAIETLRGAFEGEAALSPVRTKGLPMLLGAIQRANTDIYEAGRREPSLRGMGSTVAAVLVVGRHVVLVHVGDSRIYRLRRSVLELLTTDHSLNNDRIRSGQLVVAERSLVTRALGAGRTVEVDTSVTTSQPGDVLLLATAGLHSVVGHEELSELLEQHHDPEVAVEQLVARANAHGAPDNVTAAVVWWAR